MSQFEATCGFTLDAIDTSSENEAHRKSSAVYEAWIGIKIYGYG